MKGRGGEGRGGEGRGGEGRGGEGRGGEGRGGEGRGGEGRGEGRRKGVKGGEKGQPKLRNREHNICIRVVYLKSEHLDTNVVVCLTTVAGHRVNEYLGIKKSGV